MCYQMWKSKDQVFDYNRGVRQGCILSPLLFNLYLNEIPFILDNSDVTDPIMLPNGLPLNCLLYADDLISRSPSGLQKQIDILQKYTEKWLLKINQHKTKVLIFSKTKSQSYSRKIRLLFKWKTNRQCPRIWHTSEQFSVQMEASQLPKRN